MNDKSSTKYPKVRATNSNPVQSNPSSVNSKSQLSPPPSSSTTNVNHQQIPLHPIRSELSNSPQPHQQPQTQNTLCHSIAPKKNKPIPIAVLPKPSNSLKSTFNPNLNLHIKNSPSIKLKQEVGMNINTSKKWVLPPRPRPGRKPVNTDDEKDSTTTRDLHAKVKQNQHTSLQHHVPSDLNMSLPSTQNHPDASDDSNSLTQASKNDKVKLEKLKSDKLKYDKHKPEKSSKEKLAKEKTAREKVKNDKSKIERVKGHPRKNDIDPEVMNLKMVYLSKLKEQEFINNYIDIINNQIKQLTFIKNGYMTLDTLNQINPNPNSSSAAAAAAAMATANLNLELPSAGTTSSVSNLTDGSITPDDGKSNNFELQSESELFRNLNLNTSSENSTTEDPSTNSSSGFSSEISTPNMSPEINSDVKPKSFQDLEKVSNFQDLDKFLNYLLKSSNLLHRVTKNYKLDNDYYDINSQISKYLKLRNNYRASTKAYNNSNQQYKKAKLNNHQHNHHGDNGGETRKINTLLNENNLFDKLIIDGDSDEKTESSGDTITSKTKGSRWEHLSSSKGNGTGNELQDPKPPSLKCNICHKLTPCFCLDIDRKFNDNEYN